MQLVKNGRETKVFEFGGSSVRTVLIDEEPWWVAKDVISVLEYSEGYNPSRAIDHVPAEWKGVHPIHTPGGAQEMACLSEQGLYFFLARSDKPKALPFQKWIAGDVIPSIRKTGGYQVNIHEMTIKVLQHHMAENDRLKLENGKLQDTVNILTHTNKTYTASEIAKELGMKSAQELNNWLTDRKIQYNLNGTWLLYSKYSPQAYIHLKQVILENGRVIYDRRFTQRGREFILNLHSSESAAGGEK